MYDRTKSETVDGLAKASAPAQSRKRDRAPVGTGRQAVDETAELVHRLIYDVENVHEQIELLADEVAKRAESRLAERHRCETVPTRLVSIPEAATMLCRSVDAVYRMIQRGQIRAVRQPGGRRLDIEYREIRRYIERCRGGKSAQEGIV